jgi:hypothetical protein
MVVRRASPAVTIPAEPKTSPRTSYPYIAWKLASAVPNAPLSNRTSTTAVSSGPRCFQSGRTNAAAMAYTSTGSAPGFNRHSVSESWISVSRKTAHGLTTDGSASSGSRVNDRNSCG